MSIRSVCTLFFVAAVASMLCADAFAQRGGRGRGMMRMMGGNNQFGLLTNPRVQEELELVDDQIRELEEIQDEAMSVIRDMFSEMQDQSREGDRAEAFRNIREKMQEKMKPFEGRVKEVLLPHQHDRLKQLAFQSSGRGQGAGGALSNENLLEELGVTEKQKKELEEAMEEAREKLRKEYQKLIKEAEEEILEVLDSKQRKKYRELVGDTFDFDDGQRSRGRDRGDRNEGERRSNR